jgi:hypothetical protein
VAKEDILLRVKKERNIKLPTSYILERRSTMPHYVENSLWKRLWTCRKRDWVMNEVLRIGQ